MTFKRMMASAAKLLRAKLCDLKDCADFVCTHCNSVKLELRFD